MHAISLLKYTNILGYGLIFSGGVLFGITLYPYLHSPPKKEEDLLYIFDREHLATIAKKQE